MGEYVLKKSLQLSFCKVKTINYFPPGPVFILTTLSEQKGAPL